MKKVIMFSSVVFLGLIVSGAMVNSARGWEDDKPFLLKYYYVPFSELEEEDAEIEMHGVSGMAMIPVTLNESVSLITGLVYKGLFLDYKDAEFSFPTPEGTFTEKDLPDDLHVLDVILGANLQWNEEWGTFVIVYPGIHSDMENVSGSDIYFSGVALGSYRFSEDFLLSAGMYYDDSFGLPQLLPMLGIQWRISEVLTLDSLLPQYTVFSWRVDPRLAIGLKFNVAGNQYRLSKSKPWKDTVVKYTQIMTGPFVDFTLVGNLVLRLEGGFVINREFEFRDDDTSAKLWDGEIKDNGYIAGSLALQY
ncbi:MAG: DUF6268 family outer membrane beta-barrel protein [Candidatus Auribacterota bacterium]|nr:DUF6268 family outer membrane beta-barrel protein [Candidatus Auribacterota bacterium]